MKRVKLGSVDQDIDVCLQWILTVQGRRDPYATNSIILALSRDERLYGIAPEAKNISTRTQKMNNVDASVLREQWSNPSIRMFLLAPEQAQVRAEFVRVIREYRTARQREVEMNAEYTAQKRKERARKDQEKRDAIQDRRDRLAELLMNRTPKPLVLALCPALDRAHVSSWNNPYIGHQTLLLAMPPETVTYVKKDLQTGKTRRTHLLPTVDTLMPYMDATVHFSCRFASSLPVELPPIIGGAGLEPIYAPLTSCTMKLEQPFNLLSTFSTYDAPGMDIGDRVIYLLFGETVRNYHIIPALIETVPFILLYSHIANHIAEYYTMDI